MHTFDVALKVAKAGWCFMDKIIKSTLKATSLTA